MAFPEVGSAPAEPYDTPRFGGGPVGRRGVLRSVESAMYLRSIGAPFGIRGLYSDIIILSKNMEALLPLRNLLHPAVVVTMSVAIPNFSELVIVAGLSGYRLIYRCATVHTSPLPWSARHWFLPDVDPRTGLHMACSAHGLASGSI